MGLTVKEITSMGAAQLTECGIADAKRDSNTLYCFLVGIPESKMLTEYQYTLQDILCERYFELIDRRASGEPLQYIVGNTAFMGLPFKVNPSVLIPRQDTETLVEDAISIISKGELRNEVFGLERRSWEVLDLCTGSGAIGISIAKLLPKTNVTMSDISNEALSVAKENAALNSVNKNVKFVSGNLLEPFHGRLGPKKFDLIISNPPYIPSSVIATLQKEIREHEPMIALDGGDDGLDCYRKLAEEVPKHLKKGGILLMEIGHDQRDAVTKLLEDNGSFVTVRCYKDLAGKDRIIFAKARG